MNLPQADWKGDAGKGSGFQAFVNSLVWDNGCTQVLSGPTRGDALLIFTFSDLKVRLSLVILRPESATITGLYLKENGMKIVGSQKLKE